jgi:hypothetical protein
MPTALSKLATSLEGVGHVLRDRSLGVPPYQRSYAWGREQVEAFWWDLRSAFDAEAPDYFLGTIVLTSRNGSGRATVIDGQQRLATTTMLFTAIRDEFFRRDDRYRAGVVEADYVAGRELRSAELTPRVTLNAEDDAFFRSWVLAHPDERGECDDHLPASNRRLKSAYELLYQLLREHIDAAGPTWADTLIRWIDLLEYQARVITVEVSNDADAFLIFETLNDRGLDLTVADLLKNYLFGLARDDLGKVQRAWVSTLETLETSAVEETLTTFLRHYWSSLYGATRERELYRRLKETIRTTEAAVSFSIAMDEVAPMYAGLLNANHPVWERWPGVHPEVESLLRLGLEQNRPLALAAMQRFSDDELRRLLRALVSWSVRGLVVGGIGGGTTERAYAEAATRISSGEVATTPEVLEHLSPIVPSDDEFSRAMSTVRVNKTRLARYYLTALARCEQAHSADAGYFTHAAQEAWSLQLALPRRADLAEWERFGSEDLGQWANRLGNQFVTPSNAGLPADSGLGRAVALAASGAPVPVTVGAWTVDPIAQRHEAMAKMAPQVWPRLPD